MKRNQTERNYAFVLGCLKAQGEVKRFRLLTRVGEKLFKRKRQEFNRVDSEKQVYIISSNGSDEVDGALGLLKFVDCKKEKEFYVPEENDPKGNQMICGARASQPDQPENTCEDSGPEVLDGTKLSESVIIFQEVTGLENFRVHVDGLVIDWEFNEYIRTKYYDQCYSQRSFLHDHLLEGLNCKLAAGIISETINVADAIKASNITTSPDSLTIWDQTLSLRRWV